MPPAAVRGIDAMAEMTDFAELLTNRLLDQIRMDHESSVKQDEKFRDEIRAQVSAIRESMAGSVARCDACCHRITSLESRADGASAKIWAMLLGLLTTGGAALWGWLREK